MRRLRFILLGLGVTVIRLRYIIIGIPMVMFGLALLGYILAIGQDSDWILVIPVISGALGVIFMGSDLINISLGQARPPTPT